MNFCRVFSVYLELAGITSAATSRISVPVQFFVAVTSDDSRGKWCPPFGKAHAPRTLVRSFFPPLGPLTFSSQVPMNFVPAALLPAPRADLAPWASLDVCPRGAPLR